MKKHYTLLLLVITILLSKPITTKAQVDVNDSLALVDLYNSTDGPNWYNNTNWLTTKPVWEWYGIGLSGNKVSYIGLQLDNLKGTLPSSLGNLTQLNTLDLYHNQLSGIIPPELGNLANLNRLYLYNNQLSGSIPPVLGNLAQLQSLSLANNQLSGIIPPELGNLTNLNILLLYGNQLSGSIPPELGNLTNLNELWLNNNQLSGSIPPELGNTTPMYLNLSNNQLSGNIPSSLDNTYLFDLDLSYNRLTGSIPSSFGNCVYLYYLDLSYNKLTGHIPSFFKNLKNLIEINIAGNELRNPQTFKPDVLFNIELKSADIRSNHFTFDGIETLAQYDFDLKYAPQKKIRLHQNINKFSVYAGGTLSNNTYKWYKDGSLVATKQGDSTFDPTQSGAYTVNVTNSIATQLTLKSDTITFNAAIGIRQNDIASIQVNNKSKFSIYPNPAKAIVTVAFNTTGNCIIKLADVSGNVLQTKTVIAVRGVNTLQLDVSKYAAGVYFITLSNEENETQTLRLNK